MADEVTLVSTTDDEATVRAALGIVDPAPAADTPPAGEPPAPGSPTPVPAAPVSDKPKAERRIDKLTRERREAEEREAQSRIRETAERQRAEQLQRDLDALRSGKPPAEAVATPAADAPATPQFGKPRPKQEDFDDYDAYQAARDTWVEEKAEFAADQRVRAAFEAERQRQFEAMEQQRQMALLGTFNERILKTAEIYPDYHDVVAAATDLHPTQAMKDFIFHEDNGVAIGYYLMKNRAEFDRISRLPPGPALAALGRLDAKFEAGTLELGGAAPARPSASPSAQVRAGEPAPPNPVSASVPVVPVTRPTLVSNAPAPPPRVGAGTATPKKLPLDHPDVSQEEYKRRRAAGER